MQIKGALFDMDGVLVDNAHMHIKAFDVLYDRYNVPQEERKNVMDYMGQGLSECISHLLPPHIIEVYGIDFMCQEKERIYREIYAPEIRPIRGLVNLLAFLNANDIRCAVGSSACLENVEFVLRECGISEYFDAIVSSDSVTKCKPDPEIYLTAAARLGLAAGECIVFEDAMVGIRSAKAAGVDHVIALTTSYSISELESESPEYIIDDFTKVVPGMLKKTNIL